MKRIYLHVGMNKTGTSSIQSFFANNSHVLLDRGVLYPVTVKRGNAHHLLRKILHKGGEEGQTCRGKYLEKLRLEIESSGCDTVLLSSEEFVKTGICYESLKEVFGDTVFPIVYLRRHDSWWISLYQQALKMVVNPPWERGFSAFVRFQKERINYWRYGQFVDHLAEIFGQEKVAVRPYETKQLVRGNVCNDILSVIGVEADEQLQEKIDSEGWANKSLAVVSLLVIAELMRSRLHAGLRHNLVRVFRRLPGRTTLTELVDVGLRKELIEENIQDYRYIAKNYLGRADGQLFYDLEARKVSSSLGAKIMKQIFREK